MSIFDSIINAGASIAGSIIGSRANAKAQQSANEANMRLARYQFETNKQMWQAQNEYNTPMAQMQRLKDAGLNPALVYGSGANVGNASGAPQYEAPHISAYTGYGDFGASAAASAFLASQLTAAQVRNVVEQNKLLKQDQVAKALQIMRDNLRYQGEHQDYYYDRSDRQLTHRLTDLAVVQAEQDYDASLVDYQRKIAEAEIAKVRQRMSDVEYQRVVQQLRLDMANADIREHESRDYETLGIRPSDPMWSRVLSNALLKVVGLDKAGSIIDFLLK